MGHAVQHFFANGGSQAVVVRALAADARRRLATLKDTLDAGTEVLTLTAIGKGAWANWSGSVGLDVAGRPRGHREPRRPLQRRRHAHRTLDPREQRRSGRARSRSHLNLSMSPGSTPATCSTCRRRRSSSCRALPRRLTRRHQGTSVGPAAGQPAHDHAGGEDAARLGRLRPGRRPRALRRRDGRRLARRRRRSSTELTQRTRRRRPRRRPRSQATRHA